MPDSILIVDDEEGIREALTSILADEGYESTAVASGEQCLALLDKHPVDLVLLVGSSSPPERNYEGHRDT